ncbi:Aste57867_3828 [Aphanomyces stellatus]|uniref:Aste57867_3828 protein n=1 Tax=Aphanomyces stellatus TaxID=120398 RepID=A0A485KBI4_9STRA|nr:hypothetical protein As57867_003817 [Aphanomyces stellatus]VFT80976.1 Aste57867_3828 [Aphanomyces stellatus]
MPRVRFPDGALFYHFVQQSTWNVTHKLPMVYYTRSSRVYACTLFYFPRESIPQLHVPVHEANPPPSWHLRTRAWRRLGSTRHTGSVTAASVAADINTILALGFTRVRTVRTLVGQVDIGAMLAKAGLKLALGIPFPTPDLDARIAVAVATANQVKSPVIYLFAGPMLALPTNVSDLMRAIDQLKRRVPPTVNVGTVARVNDMTDLRLAQLWPKCHVVGLSIPF